MIKKRYRILVDVGIQFDAFSPTEAAKDWRNLANRFPDVLERLRVSEDEFVAHQWALIRALLGHEEALAAWLEREAELAVVEGELDDLHEEGFAHEILAPLLPELPFYHRRYFDDALKDDTFYERLEGFFWVNTIEPVSLTLQAMDSTSDPAPGLVVDQCFRASVEVDAGIGEVDEELAAERIGYFKRTIGKDLETSPADYAKHSQALAAALIDNETVLDAWLTDSILTRLADHGAIHLLSTTRADEILGPVVEGLPPETWAYYQRARTGNLEYEAFSSLYEGWGWKTLAVDSGGAPRLLHS